MERTRGTQPGDLEAEISGSRVSLPPQSNRVPCFLLCPVHPPPTVSTIREPSKGLSALRAAFSSSILTTTPQEKELGGPRRMSLSPSLN